MNICALDLSKKLAQKNHNQMLINPLRRRVLVDSLTVLGNWFSACYTRAKWFNCYSSLFKLKCGVLQGEYIYTPPNLLAILSVMIYLSRSLKIQLVAIGHTCVSIILNADGVLLLAPSVAALN